MSENPGGGCTTDLDPTLCAPCAYTTCNSGSPEEPGQFVAVPAPTAPRIPLTFPTSAGVNGESPTRYRLSTSSASARSAGVKSIKSSGTWSMLRAYAGGFVGNGCVGDVFSPGTSGCGTGRSS